MRYRKLGTTDLNVSVICLGTMTFGEQNTQQDGFEQMNYALERGVNFFDTSELYAVMPRKETYGKTEEIVMWTIPFIFVASTFVLPLTLLNLVIAVMSDTFERVMTNTVASDN